MQVADSYIRVSYRRLNRQEFEELSERLLNAARNLAPEVRRSRNIDYTFEEGSLFQHIVLIGGIGLGTISAVAQYHNFRLSVIEMIEDAQNFGKYSIDQFHKLTNTTPADDIYKRAIPRDLNRLRRIVAGFDEIESGNVSPLRLQSIRDGIIHDLAGLARANPAASKRGLVSEIRIQVPAQEAAHQIRMDKLPTHMRRHNVITD